MANSAVTLVGFRSSQKHVVSRDSLRAIALDSVPLALLCGDAGFGASYQTLINDVLARHARTEVA